MKAFYFWNNSGKNWLVAAGLGFFFCFSSLSCSLSAELFDISNVELSFISPGQNKFTNQTTFDFKVEMVSDNKSLSLSNAKMELFEGEDCNPDHLLATRNIDEKSQGAQFGIFRDGQKYSAQVSITSREKVFRSVCSPWVGVDVQSPDAVDVQYPPADSYVSSKSFLAAWTTSLDHGIAGLREKPYRLRLYNEPACAGEVLQAADSLTEQHVFENLTHGVTYSVQISAVDRAGNESALACSRYTEVDIYAPGFRLQDASSIDGYSRVVNPSVQIDNDGLAAYWCITSDLGYFPDSHTEPCPGGAGSFNGWYTTRPSALPLTGADGLKTYNIWLFRADGSLLSNKQTSAAIRLDQTPPGNFAIYGIGSSDDEVFDNWLTSLGQVRVKWQASAEAVNYSLEIRANDNSLLCRKEGLPAGTLSYSFALDECQPLLHGENYEIRMTSYDIARNPTQSALTFTVDLVPPEAFRITGISGGSDQMVDAFLGLGEPVIHFEAAHGATQYEIEVRDENNLSTCTVGTVNDPANLFDYRSENLVSCLILLHGGAYQAFVTALDDGKSRTPATNNGFVFHVDTQAPSLLFTSVPSAITNVPTASIAFEVEDALSGVSEVLCSLDGGPFLPCVSPESFNSVSEGAHSVSVKAKDRVGNSVTQTSSWFVDLTGPTTTITGGPSGAQSVNSATFAFSGVDVGSAGLEKFECSLNNSSFTICTSPQVYENLLEGVQSFRVRASDSLGNVGDIVTRNFVTDYTAPSLNFLSAPANPTDHLTTASVGFASSDNGSGIATIECRLDGGSWSPCTSPVNYSGLGAGNHTVMVQVTDHAGHVLALSHSWTIYTYSWTTGSWGTCSANQPNWQANTWSGCSATQPSYTYGTWGSCTASCGGGTQTRAQTCPVVNGTQSRNVVCPVTSGTENRTATCIRNDGASVADEKCLAVKPATSQSCSRNDCAGVAPVASQSCTRGGGSDCHSAQVTTQACNQQTCCSGTTVGGYCWFLGGAGQSCDTVCAGRGGANLAGIRNYAGSGGSVTACTAVLNSLGLSGSASTNTCNSGNEYTGCGSFAGAINFLCSGAATTTGGAFQSTRRACACGN